MTLAGHRHLGREVLFAHLVLAPLVFWTAPTPWSVFAAPKIAVLLLAALVLVALACDAAIARQAGPGAARRWRTGAVASALRDPLCLGVVILALSAAASTLASMSPRLSVRGDAGRFEGLATILAWAVLFFITRALCRGPRPARRLLLAAVIVAATAAVYGLVQAGGVDPIPWRTPAYFRAALRPSSMLGNPVHLGAYLAMALPVVVYLTHRAVVRRDAVAVVGFTAILVVSTATIVLSLSRGSWLAVGVASVVLIAGWWRTGERRTAAAIAVLLLATIATLAVLAIRGTPGLPLGARLAGFAWVDDRAVLWRAGLDIARDHPLLGTGPDTFRLAFERTRTPESWRALGWQASATSAHNAVLDVMATQGGFGLAGVMLIGAGAVVAVVRGWRRAAAVDRGLVVAVAAGLLAFAVQMLSSFGEPGGMSLFVTLLAVASALAAPALTGGDDTESQSEVVASSGVNGHAGADLGGSRGLSLAVAGLTWTAAFAYSVIDRASLDTGRVATTLIVVGVFVVVGIIVLRVDAAEQAASPASDVSDRQMPDAARLAFGPTVLRVVLWAEAVVIAYVVVVRPLQADVTAGTALRLVSTDPAEAVNGLGRALALDGGWAPYWAMSGRANEALYRRSTDLAARMRALRAAQQAFEHARRLVPADVQYHIDTARVRAVLASHGALEAAEAFATYDEALARWPYHPLIHTDATTAAALLDDRARLVRYASRAIELFPEYGPGHWYLGRHALSEHRLPDAARHLRTSVYAQWHTNQDGWLRAVNDLSRVLLLLEQPAEAENIARITLQYRPDDADARFSVAQALERQGKTEAGFEEYRRLLERHPEHAGAREALRRLRRAS